MYKVYKEKTVVDAKESLKNISFYLNQISLNQIGSEDAYCDVEEAVKHIKYAISSVDASLDNTLKCRVSFECE